jgi:hypothetical protein
VGVVGLEVEARREKARCPMFDFTEPIQQKRRRSVVRAKARGEGLDLDGIAERRAGAVRLDVQQSSSMSRCCGSIKTASRGEIPKKSGSKASTQSRKAPRTILARSAASMPEAESTSSQPRSGGTSDTASSPWQSSLQKPATSGAPGKRHASPITATGSSISVPTPSLPVGATSVPKAR